MTIKAFKGGLATRQHPNLIAPGQSQVYTNCDNEATILRPTKLPIPTDIEADAKWVYFEHCDKVVSSAEDEVYWAELGNYLYEATPTGITKEDCLGNKTSLGITGPDAELSLTAAGDGVLCGTYSYVYTYYNSVEGIESQPNDVSENLDTENEEAPEDILLEEKEQFKALGTKYTQIIGLSDECEDRVEAFKCAIDYAGDFTLTRFTTFITESLGVYNSAGDVCDKLAAMTCLMYGMPEGYEILPSYHGLVIRISQVLNSEEDDATKLQLVNCILEGEDYVDNLYGYESIVEDINDVLASTPPAGLTMSDDEWMINQLLCVIGNTDAEPADETVCGKAILVAGILSSPDIQVDVIRLYRVGGSITQYTLVVELPNVAQSYLDNIADEDIAGNHVLDSYTHGTPPDGPKYLTEGNSMLFVASGNQLYFSEVAKPYAWPAINYLDFDQEITGIGLVQNGLLVFTKYRTHIVTGNSPLVLSKFLISGEQGCIEHNTIAFVDNRLFWASTDGICTSNGGNIDIITQDRLGILQVKDAINAKVYNRMYLIGDESGNTLILDNRYDFSIRNIEDSGWYGVFDDTLYIQRDGYLEEMFKGENAVMQYKSPVYTIDRLSEYKTFKDVYIAFRGDIAMKAYIHTLTRDAELVFDRQLDSTKLFTDLKLKGNISGYGISFEFTGTGEVYEVDFTASGRENGK